MTGADSGMVDVVRDYLAVHRTLTDVLSAYEGGRPAFDALAGCVGGDERSVLFRLKERCHRLFRIDIEEGERVGRATLFDLAIGSLFHEAMKFRENLYQEEIYAPRVEALRLRMGDDARDLFGEFERILSGARGRVAETVAETAALLEQTRDQLRHLLIERRSDLRLTRFLIAQRERVDRVFPEHTNALLERIHGSLVEGLLAGARSYLESAYFSEALALLREAEASSPDREDVGGLARYAEGMRAFRHGEYAASVEAIEAWLDGPPAPHEGAHARLAHAALSRIRKLVSVKDEQGKATIARAKALVPRIKTWIDEAEASAPA